MRHQISWADLAGHAVGVWGLGAEGRSSLRRLRSMGIEPVIVDDNGASGTGEEVLTTDQGGLDALLATDVVVKTPGISRHRHEVSTLEAAGVKVVGGLGLWLAGTDLSRVVCVTGTKGKSTTVSILAHLATGLGHRAFVGGNLGTPPFDPDVPDDLDLYVIETSSYQAADVPVSPPIVAVTSLHPDHLPWHGDIETYYRDKLSLCTQPGADLTIASALDPELRARSDQLGPTVRWIGPDTWDQHWLDGLALLGAHNVVNAGIARACLEALGFIGPDDEAVLADACAGFPPLGSRLEHVTTLEGVDFYDDSLSTNVLPTLAAVRAFADRPVALIAGGLDRGIDYHELAAGLRERDAPTLVLTVYGTGPAIQTAVDQAGASHVEATPCDSLDQAVEAAWEWARPRKGVVLLSPASASFDAFDDYLHRARVFRHAVSRIQN